MQWFNVFQHLLPRSRAWALKPNTVLRQLISGFTTMPEDIKREFDRTWLDIFPATTRALGAWEQQWALPGSQLTEAQRRSRLEAVWKAQGGQSPHYIQNTLQAAGFNVFVFDWWEEGSDPPVAINPLLWVHGDRGIVSGVDCGEELAACGEDFAQCGNFINLPGYLLVNRVQGSREDFTACCGDPTMECGEAEALCGEYSQFIFDYIKYDVPIEAVAWRYMYYIGGEVFGDLAIVSAIRKLEFETLVLKLVPEQLWGGLFIKYQ